MNANALGQSIYYGIGLVMMKGVSLMMMPYVTQHINPTQYGMLETLLVLADIGTIIIGFGLIEALYRFVGTSEGKQRESLIANCFLLSISTALIAGLFIYISVPWLLLVLPPGLEAHQVMLIAIPTLLEGLIAIPLTLMRMQALAKWFCLLNVVKAIVQALLVIVFLETGWGIDAILIAGAISSILLVTVMSKYQFKQMAISSPKEVFYAENWTHTSTLMKYGGPIVVSRMGLFAITGLDRWILADKIGVEALAVYAIAAKFALILGLMVQPFTLWWFPNRFRLLKQKDGPQQCADFALIGVNLGVLLAASMIMTLPAFIHIFLPEDYQFAALLVIALSLVNLIKNAGDLMNLGCFSGESSQSQMWIQWSCAVCAVLGYWFFIPQWGVWAAVSVLACVYSLRLLLFYYISQRYEYLPYRHREWLKTLASACSIYGLSWLILSPMNDWVQLFGGGLFSCLLGILLIRFDVFPDILSPAIRKWRNHRLQNAKQY